MNTKSRLQVVDLFCGAGGLSLGFSKAGFDIVAPVDHNTEALETFEKNHQCSTLEADLSQNDVAQDIKQVIRENNGDQSDVSALIGGPPCKGFSQANVQTRHDDNPLNGLPSHFLDIVEVLDPFSVVLENVPKIFTMSEGKYKERILHRLSSQGYNVETVVLEAEKFGVPQQRRRAFFIGVKAGDPPIPNPTHHPEHSDLPNPITVKQAIYDLPRLPDGGGGSFSMEYAPREEYITEYTEAMRENVDGNMLYNHRTTVNREKTARRFKFVDPGNNWRQIPKKLMSNYEDRTRTHDHIYRRLIPEEPAFTVANFRKQMMIHSEKYPKEKDGKESQNRLLSIREAARLQSFPDNYVFPSNSITKKQQMVGNAVPVRLSHCVAQSLKEHILTYCF